MADVARLPAPPEEIRTAVRTLLTQHDGYNRLDGPTRTAIAQGLVRICTTVRALATEMDAAAGFDARPVLARAQSAGSEFSGVSADKVAGTTRQILNAVSFPRFVTELITGVFKAMVDSSQQQMNAYVELIRNVAATTDGFADTNVGMDGARSWLAERFPGSFTIEGETDDFAQPGSPPAKDDLSDGESTKQLRLRPGASMPTEAGLRTALGLAPGDSVPGGDPESLVGPARIAMARNRQQMLATMVMMGLQRIVIDSGRLHAAMKFHIDTRRRASRTRSAMCPRRRRRRRKR